MTYAELQVTTNFSFLRGGSHPDELVKTAKALGMSAIGITDRNTLAGVVRAHCAAKEAGLRILIGCRVDLEDAPSLLAYPENKDAYGRLCRLLTKGKMRAQKGECLLTLQDVTNHKEGMRFIIIPPAQLREPITSDIKRITQEIPGAYLAAHALYQGEDRRRLYQLEELSKRFAVPLIATNDVHYHAPSRRPLQDVLTCIRKTCRIEDAGFHLAKNAERHLKPPEEMRRIFHGFEESITRQQEILDACQFSLEELAYDYPDEPVPAGKTPQQHLCDLTWAGAAKRYPKAIPEKIEQTLKKELALIEQLNYAPYFLTVHDIVHFARSRPKPILCQGRGSAANSTVCYCLGITSVDPSEIDLLVERFISAERNEPPDIDVDFEHERREEVIQHIYERYGRERAGLAATIISYKPRSAVRDVGKVMGLTEDVTAALAGTVWGSHGREIGEQRVKEAGLNLKDPRLARTIALTDELIGFPRHLSQHVGGFVLTKGLLSETVPIGNAAMEDRTFIEWDKDDINALGIMKVDVLALGMLTCIQKAFDLMQAHYHEPHDLASIPQGDKQVYDMLCKADAIGTFQIESRAQMSMLPRLKPRNFYDLVIEIAIVRPGPIQGNMVHPYLRRRNGEEEVIIPSPAPEEGPEDELKSVLGKTLGVPLFQEQAMRLAMIAADFTPGELNDLRRAMATFRRRGTIQTFEDKMVRRMTARGYDEEFARRCFDQIKGFGEYGFPESHSASFALLAYVSAWLKCHYPDVFACALLNSQPMGFYAPAQIVRDARDHGVEVRPVDINYSEWDNTLELPSQPIPSQSHVDEPRSPQPPFAMRLGFRHVDGFGEENAAKIVASRDEPFEDIETLQRRSGLTPATLQKLADADAFRSIGHDRRQALWQVRGLSKAPPLPLFNHMGAQEYGKEPKPHLPPMALCEHVVADYQTLRLSLKAHPMSFLRDTFSQKKAVPAETLPTIKNGARIAVAGVVLVRQRPGTAKGVIFMTLEDETGVANAVIWPKTFEKYRKIIMGSRLVLLRGFLQSHDGVIHLVARHVEDHSDKLRLLADGDIAQMQNGLPLARADEVKRPGPDIVYPDHQPRRHPRDVRIIPKSRDFH